MGLIERELTKIQTAIGAPQDANHTALRAAQQALAWALDPSVFRSPLYSITGNPEDSEDCSAGSCPAPLSHTNALSADAA